MSVSSLPASDVRSRAERKRYDVLFVLTRPDPGGTLEVLVLLSKELRALGLQVAVIALYRGSAEPAPLEDMEYDILVDRQRLSLAGYVEAFFRLAGRIRALQPAAVLSFMPAANVLGAVAATLAGVRCRIASHHQIGTAQHRIVRAIDRVLGSIGVYSQVIAVSQSVRASFAGYSNTYLGRLRVIPNAIRPIAPRVDRATIRKALGIAPDAVLFAVIGRLSLEKNLSRTLSAFASVPDARLVLVGDGPQRRDIERSVASMKLDGRVVLTGQIDHQAAVDILFASDVFVQLSLFEGRSIALLEALCAQKAIIASDIAAQQEVLAMDDGSLAGLVADPEDDAAIAAAIALASDEKLRSELGARAAVLAKRIDLGRMGQEYVALLKGA